MTDYSDIFKRVESTLIRVASRNMPESKVREYLDCHKAVESKAFTDADYFDILVYVPFYAGLRAALVTQRMPTIRGYFSDYQTVANYDQQRITQILDDPKMIRHPGKIEACVHNAKVFNEIIGRLGSFQAFVDSYSPRTSLENVMRLRKDLIKRFEYLSKVTSFHFLCKIGMPVIKPDVAIRRIFFRLGLTESDGESEPTLRNVVREGEEFVRATGHPHCYVDIVFAHYGQMATPELNLDRGICLQEKPQCDLCGVSSECRYFSNLN